MKLANRHGTVAEHHNLKLSTGTSNSPDYI